MPCAPERPAPAIAQTRLRWRKGARPRCDVALNEGNMENGNVCGDGHCSGGGVQVAATPARRHCKLENLPAANFGATVPLFQAMGPSSVARQMDAKTPRGAMKECGAHDAWRHIGVPVGPAAQTCSKPYGFHSFRTSRTRRGAGKRAPNFPKSWGDWVAQTQACATPLCHPVVTKSFVRRGWHRWHSQNQEEVGNTTTTD